MVKLIEKLIFFCLFSFVAAGSSTRYSSPDADWLAASSAPGTARPLETAHPHANRVSHTSCAPSRCSPGRLTMSPATIESIAAHHMQEFSVDRLHFPPFTLHCLLGLN
jgi:hypothetical protein